MPTGLSEVIQLAMAKSADDRYPNAGEFARDLAAICSGSGTEASSRVQELLHSQRRGAHAKVLIAVLSVVALALAGGVIAFKRWKGVDPEVARRQAVSLNKEAWALLAKGGTLVSDADSIGKLVKRLEDLRGGGSKTEGRARERVLGLSGLLALAEGDAEAAARCLVGDNAPTQVALQGALAAVARDGDPVLGQRQLSRAIGRGMKRAELFGWRAHAAVRCGLKTRAQGDLALADLKILEHARGELTPKELGLRAKAFVATERFDLARDAVDAGAEPGQELRWDVAFGRAGLALDTSPKAALDAFKGLGPPGPADARCEATASAACERILRLLKSVGAGDATPSQCEILIAWAELAKRLRPEAPLPPRVKERLLLEATSLKHVQAGEIDLAVALAEVVPNDPEVQVAVARLGPVAWRRATKPERLLPAMRIGMRVAPDLDKRTLLKALVFHSLNDLHDLNPSDAYRDEALLLAKEVLSVTEDPIERGLVLWRRAALLSRLGDHDGAIVDARQAVELDASDERYHHRLALCYRSAGRVDDFVVAVGELTPRAAGADLHGRTLRLNWDIYRLHGRPVAARKGLEHLMKEVPVHAGWWVRLARVQLEVGDTVAALASLASARSHGASSKHLGAQRGPLLALTARAASAETVELAGLNTLIKALDVIRGNASLP